MLLRKAVDKLELERCRKQLGPPPLHSEMSYREVELSWKVVRGGQFIKRVKR